MLITTLRPMVAIVSQQYIIFTFAHAKAYDQIWPWCKIGQGQPRVIIWTILVVLAYIMLHTKFQDNMSIGSQEEDFLAFFAYIGMVAILVIWPRPVAQLFVPKDPGDCTWNMVTISPVVSEEKLFEIVDGKRTDRWQPAYTISSPGSGELIKRLKIWPRVQIDHIKSIALEI